MEKEWEKNGKRIFNNHIKNIDMGQDSLSPEAAGRGGFTVNNYAENSHIFYRCNVNFYGREEVGGAREQEDSGGREAGTEEARREVINEILACGTASPQEAEDAADMISCCRSASSLAAVAAGTLAGQLGMPRDKVKSAAFVVRLKALSGLGDERGGGVKNVQHQLRQRFALQDKAGKKKGAMAVTAVMRAPAAV